MQPTRLRLLAPVLISLALAGCAFPWQAQESTDPDSTYAGSGAGAQITVVDAGNQTFDVKVVLKGPDGKSIGQSNFTLKPGGSATRTFATPTRGAVTATLQYQFTGEGSAASGIDTQSLANANCAGLRKGNWTLTNVGRSAGAQWRDGGCSA
jgi:hypothetical protein